MEYSGRRLRIWRMCLPWSTVSRGNRRKIREEKNNERVSEERRGVEKNRNKRWQEGCET